MDARREETATAPKVERKVFGLRRNNVCIMSGDSFEYLAGFRDALILCGEYGSYKITRLDAKESLT